MFYDRTLFQQYHSFSDITSITECRDTFGNPVSTKVATDTMRAYNLETSYNSVVLTTVNNTTGPYCPSDIRADVNNINFIKKISDEIGFLQELYVDDLGQGNPISVERYNAP